MVVGGGVAVVVAAAAAVVVVVVVAAVAVPGACRLQFHPRSAIVFTPLRGMNTAVKPGIQRARRMLISSVIDLIRERDWVACHLACHLT